MRTYDEGLAVLEAVRGERLGIFQYFAFVYQTYCRDWSTVTLFRNERANGCDGRLALDGQFEGRSARDQLEFYEGSAFLCGHIGETKGSPRRRGGGNSRKKRTVQTGN